MVFENFIEVGNLGFGKMILVGILSWAVSTWSKTGQKPITNPPGERSPGVSFILAAQNFRVREPIERIADIGGVIKLPAAYKRIRERLDCVAVERLQDVNQTGRNSAHSVVSNALAAFKRDR